MTEAWSKKEDPGMLEEVEVRVRALAEQVSELRGHL